MTSRSTEVAVAFFFTSYWRWWQCFLAKRW